MQTIEMSLKTMIRLGRYGTMNDTPESVIIKMMNYLNPDYFVERQMEEEWEIE